MRKIAAVAILFVFLTSTSIPPTYAGSSTDNFTLAPSPEPGLTEMMAATFLKKLEDTFQELGAQFSVEELFNNFEVFAKDQDLKAYFESAFTFSAKDADKTVRHFIFKLPDGSLFWMHDGSENTASPLGNLVDGPTRQDAFSGGYWAIYAHDSLRKSPASQIEIALNNSADQAWHVVRDVRGDRRVVRSAGTSVDVSEPAAKLASATTGDTNRLTGFTLSHSRTGDQGVTANGLQMVAMTSAPALARNDAAVAQTLSRASAANQNVAASTSNVTTIAKATNTTTSSSASLSEQFTENIAESGPGTGGGKGSVAMGVSGSIGATGQGFFSGMPTNVPSATAGQSGQNLASAGSATEIGAGANSFAAGISGSNNVSGQAVPGGSSSVSALPGTAQTADLGIGQTGYPTVIRGVGGTGGAPRSGAGLSPVRIFSGGGPNASFYERLVGLHRQLQELLMRQEYLERVKQQGLGLYQTTATDKTKVEELALHDLPIRVKKSIESLKQEVLQPGLQNQRQALDSLDRAFQDYDAAIGRTFRSYDDAAEISAVLGTSTVGGTTADIERQQKITNAVQVLRDQLLPELQRTRSLLQSSQQRLIAASPEYAIATVEPGASMDSGSILEALTQSSGAQAQQQQAGLQNLDIATIQSVKDTLSQRMGGQDNPLLGEWLDRYLDQSGVKVKEGIGAESVGWKVGSAGGGESQQIWISKDVQTSLADAKARLGTEDLFNPEQQQAAENLFYAHLLLGGLTSLEVLGKFSDAKVESKYLEAVMQALFVKGLGREEFESLRKISIYLDQSLAKDHPVVPGQRAEVLLALRDLTPAQLEELVLASPEGIRFFERNIAPAMAKQGYIYGQDVASFIEGAYKDQAADLRDRAPGEEEIAKAGEAEITERPTKDILDRTTLDAIDSALNVKSLTAIAFLSLSSTGGVSEAPGLLDVLATGVFFRNGQVGSRRDLINLLRNLRDNPDAALELLAAVEAGPESPVARSSAAVIPGSSQDISVATIPGRTGLPGAEKPLSSAIAGRGAQETSQTSARGLASRRSGVGLLQSGAYRIPSEKQIAVAFTLLADVSLVDGAYDIEGAKVVPGRRMELIAIGDLLNIINAMPGVRIHILTGSIPESDAEAMLIKMGIRQRIGEVAKDVGTLLQRVGKLRMVAGLAKEMAREEKIEIKTLVVLNREDVERAVNNVLNFQTITEDFEVYVVDAAKNQSLARLLENYLVQTGLLVAPVTAPIAMDLPTRDLISGSL